jgi:Zinc knuckle
VTKVRGTERHIGNVNVYMLRFNSLICRSMLSMSEVEQRVTRVRGFKPNVKFEVEKEGVKMAGISISLWKKLADKTDNLFWGSRTQRPYESALGGDVSGPTPMQLESMTRTFDQFKIPLAKRNEVMSKRLCFNCMEPGHKARKCPKNE